MDEDQRLRTLERDLGRLEGVVESLLSSVRMEHETARQARLDDRASMAELGGRMEQAIKGLAEEVKKIAQETSKQDLLLSTHDAKGQGAWGVSRWLFASSISVAVLLTSWIGSQAGSAGGSCPREADGPPPRPELGSRR